MAEQGAGGDGHRGGDGAAQSDPGDDAAEMGGGRGGRESGGGRDSPPALAILRGRATGHRRAPAGPQQVEAGRSARGGRGRAGRSGARGEVGGARGVGGTGLGGAGRVNCGPSGGDRPGGQRLSSSPITRRERRVERGLGARLRGVSAPLVAPVARVGSIGSATRVGPRASVLTICLRHHHHHHHRTRRDVAHTLGMSAHSRPSHYNIKPTFYPLLVILFFFFRDCTANHTLPPNHPPPVLFLASTLFLVPSYTWDGGGRRFVILKKC